MLVMLILLYVLACMRNTDSYGFGLSRSSRVRRLRPMNSSQGAVFVVA